MGSDSSQADDFADILGPSLPPPEANLQIERQSAVASAHLAPTFVTESDLAVFWGVTARQVRMLVSERRIEKLRGGRFELQEATQRYIAALIGSAKMRGGADPELRAEKLRIAREQADQLELKNAAARGELVSAASVKTAWADVLRDVRAGMLAAPSRIAQRLPHLTPHDLEMIDREIRDALSETADGNS